ncbi:hypothetical protein CSUI_010691, partial [Cystoisospora suis]
MNAAAAWCCARVSTYVVLSFSIATARMDHHMKTGKGEMNRRYILTLRSTFLSIPRALPFVLLFSPKEERDLSRTHLSSCPN